MARLVVALALLAGLAVAAPAPARADVVDDNVAAVSRGAGDVVAFARGADGAVHFRVGVDGTWASMGGQATSGPAAAVRADGTIDVFVRGASDAIFHATLSGTTPGPWTSLGGRSMTGPGAVQRRGRSETDLFYVNPARSLIHRFRDGAGGSWSAEEDLGPTVISAPGPSSRSSNNQLDVFVRGGSDDIYNRPYVGPAGGWQPYTNDIGGFTASAPSAITRSEHDLDVFVRGTDRQLHQRHYFGDGRGYGAWERVDARELSSGPGATIDGPTRVHVFARDGADVLVKSFQDGTGWAPWRSLGPVAPPAPTPQPPAPAPAPVGGGRVSFEAGLSCTPRGGEVDVSIVVRKRPGRAKPRVTRVVFYYRRGERGRVVRTDRRAPYARSLPVDLEPGTHRVFARIEYRRGRKAGRKTVSRRFAVCG